MSPHDGHVGYRAWVGSSGVGGNYKPRGEGGDAKHERPMRRALIGENLKQLVHHHLASLVDCSEKNMLVCENAITTSEASATRSD